MIDIVVLNHKIHGLSASDYADTLRERFPEQDIALAETHAEREEYTQEARIATGYEIDKSLIETSDTLNTFICTFAGTDHLPIETLEANDVTLESASGVHGPNVAEQVLGYILTYTRRLHQGWQQEHRNEWNHYQAGELAGSTATVVGLGPIGKTIVDRLNAFNVETVGVRYTPSKGGPADEIIGFNDSKIEKALTQTDYLVLSCPLTDTTKELISTEEFTQLPTHAVVANIARGEVIILTDRDTDTLRAD